MTLQSHFVRVGTAAVVQVGTNVLTRSDKRGCFLHYFDILRQCLACLAAATGPRPSSKHWSKIPEFCMHLTA